MKRTVKRSLILLTAAALLLTLIPAGAFAADDFGIWICGSKVTSENLSGPGWSFDLSKYTLKLKDFSYSGADMLSRTKDGTEYYCGIFYRGEGPALTIELSGKNTIALKGVPEDNSRIFGITSGADLTITGNGSLDLSTDTIKGDNVGIWAKKDLILNGGTVHISTGGGKGSNPIECSGNLIINQGNYQLEAAPSDYPIGIWCDGDMMMKGGSVSAVCGNITQEDLTDEAAKYSYGIRVKNSVTVEDGQITAKSGDTGTIGGQMSLGLVAMKDLTIKGGSVTAESGEANYQSIACSCMGKFTMEAGELTAAADGVSGIFTTTSSTIQIPSGVGCFGLFMNSRQETAEFRGGTITARAGKSRFALGASIGIRANSDFNISGGSVTAEAAESDGQSIGMDSQGTLNILKGVKNFSASGMKVAVSGKIKTEVNGTGYTDAAGTEDKTTIKADSKAQTLTYRHLSFPKTFSFSTGK